jgi:hypothetical protein
MSDTELNAEIAGNKVNLKNLPLNWIAIIGVLFVSVAGLYVINEHRAEAKDSRIEVNAALKDLAGAQTFFACIIAQPAEDRMKQFESDSSFCNRMARR